MEAEAADAAPAGPEAASSAPTSAAPHAAVEAAAAAPAPAPAAAPADAGAAGAAPAPSGAQQQKARGKVEVEDALKYLDEVRGFFLQRGTNGVVVVTPSRGATAAPRCGTAARARAGIEQAPVNPQARATGSAAAPRTRQDAPSVSPPVSRFPRLLCTALSLSQIKTRFGHKPQTYNRFLEIMKAFKSST
jgi:pyruvate dehydrogenase E2 component (dihydrolipoamide acetyltransferase)